MELSDLHNCYPAEDQLDLLILLPPSTTGLDPNTHYILYDVCESCVCPWCKDLRNERMWGVCVCKT